MNRRIFLLAIAFFSGCSGRPEPSEAGPKASAPVASEPVAAKPVPNAAVPIAADEEFVSGLLVEQMAVDRAKIDMNRPIGEPPLDADDLDLVEIIMELEEHFDVTIPDEELEKVAGGKGEDLPASITPAHLVTLVRQARDREAGSK